MGKVRERSGLPEKEPKHKGALRELFDIPRSAIAGNMHIEISGNTEAVVGGCTGVLEYDENIIRLAGNKMSVKFTGRRLQLKLLTHDSAIIEGFILGMEFTT